VRALKGEGRPFNPQTTRAEMLMALKCVDHVFVFEDDNCSKVTDVVKPNIYVKGRDYKLGDPYHEAEFDALQSCGATIIYVLPVFDLSTTERSKKVGDGNG
jgi:D-beta-D-heptose 7-phosphate kinase/D-beta-D-heptose 1-phosphate adenosyltransferase